MCDTNNPTLNEAWCLEKYLIPFEQWNREELAGIVPDDMIKELFSDDHMPIGLGKHPEKGWFVLGAGQGPCILWSQWKE